MTIITPHTSTAGGRMRKRKNPASWVVLALMSLLVFVWAFPYMIVFMYSMKNPFAGLGILDLPDSFRASYYIQAWQLAELTPKFFNSLYISFFATLISLVLAFFIAFGLGIGKSKRRVLVMTLCMIAYAIPQEAVMFPGYKVAKTLNLYGAKISVSIILGILYSAFATYLLTSVMADFPKEILEAAHLDGATTWQLARKIVFPIVRPTLAALGVMIFIWTWNEYMMPLILLPDNENQTMPISIAQALGHDRIPTNTAFLAMACVLGSLPSIVFFLIFQNTITRGITAGSVD